MSEDKALKLTEILKALASVGGALNVFIDTWQENEAAAKTECVLFYGELQGLAMYEAVKRVVDSSKAYALTVKNNIKVVVEAEAQALPGVGTKGN